MQHQLDDYRACGMTATVSKPVEIRALMAAIQAAVEPQAQRAAVRHRPSSPRMHDPRDQRAEHVDVVVGPGP